MVIATLLYNACACFIQLPIAVSGRERFSKRLLSLYVSAALCACVSCRNSSIVYGFDGPRDNRHWLALISEIDLLGCW